LKGINKYEVETTSIAVASVVSNCRSSFERKNAGLCVLEENGPVTAYKFRALPDFATSLFPL